MSTKTFLVDLRKEQQKHSGAILSDFLLHHIRQTLDKREMVLLFLNRRGYSTISVCTSCGQQIMCPHCDIAMTYHHSQGEFYMCHSCSYLIPDLKECPNCKKKGLHNFGVGTQQVEEVLRKAFPKSRIRRADSDTLRKKGQHEAFIKDMENHQIDIVIGTQIIAKGLDVHSVGLVGVINADVGMYIPDFRAGERLYQLMNQVMGRTGRKGGEHTVIVQSFNTEHPILQLALTGDYDTFAKITLEERKPFRYPPYGKLIKIICSNKSKQQAKQTASKLKEALEDNKKNRGEDTDIFLSPAFIHKRHQKYRYNIILRGANPRSLLENITIPKGCSIDVDPQNIL